ncbi:hypothetical protein [Candidatus Odyssella thessalonicensis]|uniref:hypothetical protein n=1 Tax=Candidatus Odyssella thessalonicensis TaxID=84647 RepID=UPI0011129A61|nr:hypothetical protein [Candidatus Odyssella thessalonicensis]
MNYPSLVLGTGMLVLSLTACSHNEPLYNVDHHPLPPYAQKLSLNEIETIISQTASRRGWECHPKSYNKMVCNVKRRNHTAVLEINYTNTYFSIVNLNAYNLNYKDGNIHPKYNKWVRLLENEIESSISRKASAR